MNAKMADLKRSFEAAGFDAVRTVLSSGNIVFDARSASPQRLQQQAEAAMAKHLGHAFATVVRTQRALHELIDADPFAGCAVPDHAKRVVTFLAQPPDRVVMLPIEFEGARLLALRGLELLSAYEPHPRGPVFMKLIEKTFGTNLTTRTWDTVKRCAIA